MRQRYYDTEIKRFINQDILTGSIGDSQSLNRYAYVQGNPVSFSDPFGLILSIVLRTFDFALPLSSRQLLNLHQSIEIDYLNIA